MGNLGKLGKNLKTSRTLIWSVGLSLAAAVGMVAFAFATKAVEDDAQARFEYLTRSTQYGIVARVKSYSELVRGVAAVFRTNDQLSRAQFHDYIDSLDVARQFPAVDAFTYTMLVSDAGRDAFVAGVRRDRSVAPDGYPDFDIKPPGRRPSYAVLTYAEPMSVRADKFGADLSVDPLIERAMAASRDSGQITSSGQPMQIKLPTPHIGLGMRLPVYRQGAALNDVASRRAAYLGSVNISFSVPRLVQGAIDEMAERRLHLRLYADNSVDVEQRGLAIVKTDRLLFSDDGAAAAAAIPAAEQADYFESVLPVDFNGSLWKAHFRVRKAEMLTGFDRYFPWLSLLAAVAGTMLLYGYMFVLVASRR